MPVAVPRRWRKLRDGVHWPRVWRPLRMRGTARASASAAADSAVSALSARWCGGARPLSRPIRRRLHSFLPVPATRKPQHCTAQHGKQSPPLRPHHAVYTDSGAAPATPTGPLDSMKTTAPLVVVVFAALAGASMWPQPMFGSAPPLVNRKVHASYINSSAGPIRVVQVVNVNVLPVRVSPPQGRDVETMEDHDNSIPVLSDDRRTQVDVFLSEPPLPPQTDRRPPPLRLTDYAPFLESNHVPQHPPAKRGHFLLPLAAYTHDAELHDDYLDQIVDFTLEIVCREIHAKGKDEVAAPDLHREFVRKLGPLQLKGSFDATGGMARNLSTLRRTEPVTVSRQGDTLQIRAGLGLATLAARYDHYQAHLGSIQASGQLTATVASDSIAVTVNVTLGQANCLTLDDLHIDQLGDIDVKLTGLGELSWLTSKIVTWLSDHFKTDVATSVEKQLREGVSQVLGRVKCDMQHFLSLSMQP